jgi:excisionase family DNA binding protein
VAHSEDTSKVQLEQPVGRSVSLDRAALLLGVSRRTVYNRIREGRLRTIRTRGGSQRVILESMVDVPVRQADIGCPSRSLSGLPIGGAASEEPMRHRLAIGAGLSRRTGGLDETGKDNGRAEATDHLGEVGVKPGRASHRLDDRLEP